MSTPSSAIPQHTALASESDDPIWKIIQNETRSNAAEEPVLASFLRWLLTVFFTDFAFLAAALAHAQ